MIQESSGESQRNIAEEKRKGGYCTCTQIKVASSIRGG